MQTKIQQFRKHLHGTKSGILKVNKEGMEWMNHQMIEFIDWTSDHTNICSCRFSDEIDLSEWQKIKSAPVKAKFLDRESNAYFLVTAILIRPALELSIIDSSPVLDLHIKGIRMFRMKEYGDSIRILEPQL